jgi:hypothetical protein
VFFFVLGKENFFAECFLFDTRQSCAEALPSVFYLALGKAVFAERPKKNAQQSLRRSAKKRIPVVNMVTANCSTLQVHIICIVHSQLTQFNQSRNLVLHCT